MHGCGLLLCEARRNDSSARATCVTYAGVKFQGEHSSAAVVVAIIAVYELSLLY